MLLVYVSMLARLNKYLSDCLASWHNLKLHLNLLASYVRWQINVLTYQYIRGVIKKIVDITFHIIYIQWRAIFLSRFLSYRSLKICFIVRCFFLNSLSMLAYREKNHHQSWKCYNYVKSEEPLPIRFWKDRHNIGIGYWDRIFLLV